MVPVLCGSAFKKRGVQPLVDAVVDYLPSPLDIPAAVGMVPGHEDKVEVPSDDNAKFCSLAFKLWTDPYVGKLVFFRVYSGQLKKGDMIYNPRTRKRERVSRVMMIQADKRIDVETTYAGDIAALVGLKNITTGDTLCDEDFDIMLEPPTFPSRLSRWPSNRRPKPIAKKWAKVCSAWLKKIRRSVVSPTKKPASLSSPGWASCTWKLFATVCSANSRSAPMPARRKLRIAKPSPRRPKAKANSSVNPAVAVNTAMRASRLSPNERGKGVEIENKIVGGAIPKEYIPAVIDGVEEAIKGGVLAGYPVVDVKVAIIDGTFHEVDSSELAFKMAGIFALKDAAKKANPILLEPIMKVEVTTPDEYQGDLLGDINRRRGKIVSIEAKDTPLF